MNLNPFKAPPGRRSLLLAAMTTALTALAPLAATAQALVAKPITLLVPFAAGSPTDVAARAFAQEFGTQLGTNVIVDNKPGAYQTIAGVQVWRAAPDGYTLLFANLPAVLPPSVKSRLPYAGLRDFSPVSDVLDLGFVLVTAPGVPANNLKEFIALVKAEPGKYSYGSSGVGTPIHLMGEMFNKEVGASTLHVPYKGGNQVQLDLVADRVSFAFLPLGVMEYVRAGKLKAFAIASDKRDRDYPEVPTTDEAGLKGFRASVKFVVVGPKGLPPEVLGRLNAAANKVIASDAFYQKVKAVGGVDMSPAQTPQQVQSRITDEEAKWDALLKKANIQLE